MARGGRLGLAGTAALAPFLAALALLAAGASAAQVVLADDRDEPEKPDHGIPTLDGIKATFLDEKLEADFREKSERLKVKMDKYRLAKERMEEAKKEANEAMHKLRVEAARKRKELAEQQRKLEAERQEREESARRLKSAILQSAQHVAATTEMGVLGAVSLETLVDVLISLPDAVANKEFMDSVNRSKTEVQESVDSFLTMQQRKTANFVSISTSASEMEFSYYLAKFFHESSFRLKALHKDIEREVKELRLLAPAPLRTALAPIFSQIWANAAPLKVNATDLAGANLAQTCDQVSGIMSNISDYDSKLSSMHEVLENATQQMIPVMDQIMAVSSEVTDFVKTFLNMALLETGSLRDAAHEIVLKVGPVLTERIQCTWSTAGPRFSLSFLVAAVALLASRAIF